MKDIETFASADGVIRLSDVKIWRNHVIRTTKGAGGSWLINLLPKIQLVNNGIPILVDQTKDDAYGSKEFMVHVITLANQAGRRFVDINPCADDCFKKNFQAVEADIASFGAQIAGAVPKEKSDIFNQEDLMEFPLSPILEWHMLYRSYDPHMDKDSTKYWKSLNKILAEPLDVATKGSLSSWVSRLSNARSDLTKCEPGATVDSAMIGQVLTKFTTTIAKDEPGATLWQIESHDWEKEYRADKSKYTWMKLKQAILETIDVQEDRVPEMEPAQTPETKRVRLNPTLPTGMAMMGTEFSFDGWDANAVYEYAFTAGMMARGSGRDTRTCHTCHQIGHISRNCPVNNPQGMQMLMMQPRMSRHDPRSRAVPMGGHGMGPMAGRGMSPVGAGGGPVGAGGGGPVSAGGFGGPMSAGGDPRGGQGAGVPRAAMMGGGAGFPTGQNGHRAQPFGRGIPSIPLHQAVPQAAMFADYSQYSGADYSQYAAAQEQQQPPVEQFIQQSQQPIETAFTAHIPGGAELPPGVDRDEYLRQQVFGQRFGLDDTVIDVEPRPTPEWTDPADADSHPPIDPELSRPTHPVPHRHRGTLRQNWQSSLHFAIMILTYLPTPLFLLINVLRNLPRPNTPGPTLSLILMFLILTSSIPGANTTMASFSNTMTLDMQLALVGALGANSTTLDSYLIDSGCTTSIIADGRLLSNFRRVAPVVIRGLTGDKTYNWTATLTLPVRTIRCDTHLLRIENVYWDETGSYNLVASDQLNKLGFKVVLDEHDSALQQKDAFRMAGSDQPVSLPVAKIGSLYLLPVDWAGAPTPPTPWQRELDFDVEFSFLANCNMTLEELVHLRMAHTPIARCAQMSRKVKGLPRSLNFHRALRFPCGCCQEAKAIRQPFPPASNTMSRREDDLMCWDMFDMGEKHLSLSGNRYVSVFVVHRSRYAIVLLHKDRTFETMKSLLIRAFARAGFTPKRVRHDGAGEYINKDLEKWLEEQGAFIVTETSNPYEQHQDGISEKLVDTMGKGIRTLLLQSGLPPEFWGAAALYYADVYNHLPHASLDGEIPFEIHHNKTPDVSWFRPWGCRCTLFRGRDLVEHGKLAPRGEQGVLLGLSLSHGRKCWVVYCPRLNRIFVSRNVTFDETLFPMRQNDQRVYGIYDNQAVQEMRADAYGTINPVSITDDVLTMPCPKDPVSKLIAADTTPTFGLDSLESAAALPNVFAEPLPDSDDEYDAAVEESEQSQRSTQPSVPNAGPTMLSGGNGGVAGPSGGVSEARGGVTRASRGLTGASGGVTGPSGGGMQAAGGVAPAGEFRPPKRARFNDAPPSYGVQPANWWDCENEKISDVTDPKLAEFLIGHSINLEFPHDYWPRDQGRWAGEAFDTAIDSAHFGMSPCLKFLLTAGPKSRKFGEHAILPISHTPAHGRTNVSVRRAIAVNFPHAVYCKDLTISREGRQTGNGKPKTVTRQRRSARLQEQLPAGLGLHAAPINFTPAARLRHSPEKCRMPALYAFATSMMLEANQANDQYIHNTELAEPKNERAARASSHAKEWLIAEEIELKTIYKMGTFEIVDLPPGVVPLPSRFTYKIKRDKHGVIAKLKARLVARGDMQTKDEYSTTFAPTARFTAIRTVISIAAQEKMSLKQWDISGAFMTADIDTDVYMDLPPGYHLPPGKVIKLRKSLYGLRQSPGLFHDSLEAWLRNYGFKAINEDGTIFKLVRGHEHVILTLFVDDGLCATNSESLYQTFLKDLRGKYDLSDQGDASFYLGVSIDHNVSTGVTTLGQEQFVQTMLERFNMVGCKPVSTPSEPNTHLVRGDQPRVPDPQLLRDYQRLIGGLMYLSCFTRPDISHAVNQCSKFMSNPGPEHMIAAKRILHYLSGTKHLKLTYRRSENPLVANRLTCYADSDHAGDPDTRRSVTGFVVLLNGGAISWQSIRQQVTALSSAEAEYYAASAAGADVTYVRRLMEDLGYTQVKPTTMFEDNMACIFMSRSSASFHKV